MLKEKLCLWPMKLRVNGTIAPGILYRFVSPDDQKIANALLYNWSLLSANKRLIMVFQDLYFWLGKINGLKERDKYYKPVFNYLKYSRDKAVPCDNLTSNRPSLLFVSKSRSPLTPLNKGGTINLLKLPRISGDLGASRLEDKRHLLLWVWLLSCHGLTRPLSSQISVLHSPEN